MKKTFGCLAIAAALAACHGGSSGSLQRKDQQQYDVVQEGQASGTSTALAGDTAPMTATNADTTSNFTLPQVATSGTQPGQPGTLAGQMPQTTPGSMTSSYPAAPPRPRTTAPRPPATAEPPRHTEAPRTDTTGTMTEGPPPSTNTVPPNTDTAPPPDRNRDRNNPPPSTDTTPQPPPTTTT